MHKLTRDLKAIMKEKRISKETASHFLNVAPLSIHRWINNNIAPTPPSQRKIQEGIVKIREAYPTTVYEQMLKARTLYRKISRHVTYQEKAELFHINQSQDTEAYIKMLEELVKRYAQDKRQIQMFNPSKKGGD